MAKFKENTNMFHIGTMEAPIIHGHTCIELKDARTGKRERIESDNTFMATTLAKQMRSLGAANNFPYANETWRNSNMIVNFCGGIFLFKNAIADDSEYMAAGNKMTANGSYNITNGGNPPELGSWNSIESNIDGNRSAVLVWDWNTSQGNGEISSICLTSDTGGYIGYGNPSGYSASSGYNLNRNQNALGPLCKTAWKNHRYSFGMSDYKTLVVKKYKYAIDKASIFDNKLIDTLTFDLESYGFTFPRNRYSIKLVDNGKVQIMPDANDVPNGGTIKLYIFDPADDSLTLKTMVNTTGTRLHDYYNTEAPFVYFKDDDLMFCKEHDTGTLYICDGSNGAVLKTFNVGSDDYHAYSKFSDDLFYRFTMSHFLDLVNDTWYPTNARADQINVGVIADEDMLLAGVSWDSSEYTSYAFKNPLYLATINNLQQSVTKQNTQTMKVTYTLTEV